MKKIFCVMGRSSSGKSTLSKEAAKQLGLTILTSYTTRPPRPAELDGETDHIFITEDEVDKYRDDIMAYTVINGYQYFCTYSQLMECDIYIIDPNGYYELSEKTKELDIELIPIYITVSKTKGIERAKKRKDNIDSYLQRYESENQQFTEFEKSNLIWYRILNHGTLEEGIERLVRIIDKER